jgi:hypothetical protein
MTPEFGLTQYRLGAVVLILKQILRSVGLRRVITEETGEVNGPAKTNETFRLLGLCLTQKKVFGKEEISNPNGSLTYVHLNH